MKKVIINILKFLLFLSIGVTILYFVFQNAQAGYLEQCELDGIPEADCSLLNKILADFKSADRWWILAVFGAFTLSNISRAIRWGMLIEQLGRKPRFINTFIGVILTYFANLGLPRMGEVVRAATVARYEKIPVEKIIGTIVVDRTMDLISMALIIGLSFMLEFEKISNFLAGNQQGGDDSGSIWQSPVFLGLLGFGLLALVLFYVFKKQILASKFYQKIRSILQGFWEGIQTIRKLNKPWLFILHSINVWVMYYFMTYLCFFAFDATAHLTPLAGLIVFVFGAFGILIPSPGGMGTYHWLATQALAIYGISPEDAFSFANILFFSVQIFYNVFLGIIALIVIGPFNINYDPPPLETAKADG